MVTCAEIRAQTALYLDNELQGVERVTFEAHILTCPSCHKALVEEREFIQRLRSARPLYNVPPELQERIERIIAEGSRAHLPRGPAEGRNQEEETAQPLPVRSRRYRWAAAAIILLAALLGAIWYRTRSRPPALSELARTAIAIHLDYLRGRLPLEIVTESPQQVSDWFAGKLLFNFRLPNYEMAPGEQKYYKLEGARLVSFKQDKAAYVSYRMSKKLVSLLVTSDTMTQPSGGEEIVSRGLTFHFQSYDGLKVITWSDRGLTYALVSDLEERGQNSCLVCHQGAGSKQLIEPLEHKNSHRR